jgi:hypothetical protein
LAGVGHDLQAETLAEAEHAVAELLTILVVHELVGEALLELRQLLCGRFVLLCREWIAGWRYPCGVHSPSSFLWAGLRGVQPPAGPFLI